MSGVNHWLSVFVPADGGSALSVGACLLAHLPFLFEALEMGDRANGFDTSWKDTELTGNMKDTGLTVAKFFDNGALLHRPNLNISAFHKVPKIVVQFLHQETLLLKHEEVMNGEPFFTHMAPHDAVGDNNVGTLAIRNVDPRHRVRVADNLVVDFLVDALVACPVVILLLGVVFASDNHSEDDRGYEP